MRVFIVYAHPSEDSFTSHVRDSFIDGLKSAGHSYVVSDLYKMGFTTDMSETEYLRESYYNEDAPIADDVLAEQKKINESDAIVFMYPVFWTEAPAKLVGWFDRVWTYGFAYGNRSMKLLDKGLVICVAGRSLRHLQEHGHYESMRAVMFGDRLFDRVKEQEFIVLDSTTRANMETRTANWDKHLRTAYEAGRNL